jgi:hypothetical protein
VRVPVGRNPIVGTKTGATARDYSASVTAWSATHVDEDIYGSRLSSGTGATNVMYGYPMAGNRRLACAIFVVSIATVCAGAKLP